MTLAIQWFPLKDSKAKSASACSCCVPAHRVGATSEVTRRAAEIDHEAVIRHRALARAMNAYVPSEVPRG